MPNTKSAEKALRQSHRRRTMNVRKKRSLKTVLKAFERAVEAKNKTEAQKLFSEVQQALDKSAKANIMTPNTAARKKSRLSGVLKKIA